MRYNIQKRTPNTIFDEIFNDEFFAPRASYGNHIDVYQENGNFVVEVDLPGYKKEEIDVQFNNDVLTIKADHKEEEEKQDKKYYYRSRRCTSFMRQIRFNNIDASKLDAAFKDGVLKILLPTQDSNEVVNKIEVK